jgi:[ribosomal protein S5]-alanine N-acetyltransferase
LSDSIVTLEPFNRSVARELFAALQDPPIYEHIDDAPPDDFVQYETRCALLENTYAPNGVDRWLNWAVRVDGAVAGYVQATVYAADRAAEIAFVFNSAFWGRGITAQATGRMLDVLAREHDVTTLWVTIQTSNQRSLALANRLGFGAVDAATYPYDNFSAGDCVMRRIATS